MNHQANKTLIDKIQLNYTNIPLAVFLFGANGSGKSTLRNYLNLSDIQINIDPDILNRIFKIKSPPNYLVASAKQALTMYNQAITNNLNLCIESTLSGHGTMQRIIQAKNCGYYVVAYFVGLNDVALNLQRVSERVARGGHFIADELVKKRYFESMGNLVQVKQYLDELYVLDNSLDSYRLQFSWLNKKTVSHSYPMVNWAAKLFAEHFITAQGD